ncbi:bifunctional precorrin-2 dehydrogenase/sirohydrochlorin ferrochelatase [Chloroflexi bacterium TSY]|nr:bifunctional precorrin-2 dehydrogenase/sirohydrochlorin ferrochelatase [Chloroflexi bacterium TSY]
MKTYPINLVLKNRLVVLIGGKGEITRKISGLLEVGALVRVIAPSVDPMVQNYAYEERIEWLARVYQPGDLSGATLVFAMTHNPFVHDEIWAEGQANGQLVNVMDVLPQCNFHAASLVRRGQLTISIGTGGAAPALAVTLRKRFEQEFGEEYAEFLDYAQTIRPLVAQQIPDFKSRSKFWYELIESDALELLRLGKRIEFEENVTNLFNKHIDQNSTPTSIAVS